MFFFWNGIMDSTLVSGWACHAGCSSILANYLARLVCFSLVAVWLCFDFSFLAYLKPSRFLYWWASPLSLAVVCGKSGVFACMRQHSHRLPAVNAAVIVGLVISGRASLTPLLSSVVFGFPWRNVEALRSKWWKSMRNRTFCHFRVSTRLKVGNQAYRLIRQLVLVLTGARGSFCIGKMFRSA